MNHLESDDGSQHSITSVQDWQRTRVRIVTAFESVAGAFPTSRCDLAVAVEEEVDCGSYLRRLITYSATAAHRTPAYLCIPKSCLAEDGSSSEPAPAVLCLHGTDNEVGHGTVVGLSQRKNRSYASELAERGFVTLSPSYPLLANYQVEPHDAGFETATMMAIWDNVRGLDLLDVMECVSNRSTAQQPGQYGAVGHSLGGHNSVFTALFEPRIAAIVSSCGLDSFRDYKGGRAELWEPGQCWTSKYHYPYRQPEV